MSNLGPIETPGNPSVGITYKIVVNLHFRKNDYQGGYAFIRTPHPLMVVKRFRDPTKET